MSLKKIGKMITGLSLSAILCFGSVGEAFGAMYVMAAGEETAAQEDEDSASVDGSGEEASGEEESAEEASGEEAAIADDVSGEEAAPVDDASEDASISENEAEGDEDTDPEEGGSEEKGVSANEAVSENDIPVDNGGSNPADEYPYEFPDEDPAYEAGKVWVHEIYDEEITYSKNEYKPHPFVFFGEERLIEGRDYTLSWKNNINAYICDDKAEPTQDDFDNAPQVIITMKGSFKGTTRAFFNIHRRGLMWWEIEPVDTVMAYTGKKLDYKPVLRWGSEELKAGRDFDFGVYDNESGEFRPLSDKELTEVTPEYEQILVFCRGKGNYDSERYCGFRIIQAENAVNVSDLKISDIPAQQFTGTNITPDKFMKKGEPFELQVFNGKTLLKAGVDYDIVGPITAINPGKYYITIEGTMKPGTDGVTYVGQKQASFVIECDISKAEVSGLAASYSTKGGDTYVRPDESVVSLKLGSTEIPDHAYDISYTGDKKAGTAKMTFTGKDGFKGKKTVKYKITARDISSGDIHVEYGYYMKKGAKPAVIIGMDDDTLVEGVDYKLSYKNNKKYGGPKAPTVTIQGKGLYTGKVTKEFEIKQNQFDEEDFTITIKDKAYKNKAGAFISKPVITDKDGAKLKAGVDYEKEIVYKSEYGQVFDKTTVVGMGQEVLVFITGKGAYASNVLTAKYKIIESGFEISKAKVKIADQYYKAGEKVYIPLDDTSIQVTMKGRTLHRLHDGNFVDDTLDIPRDGFEVVSGSYKKNDKCGTASVVIHGVGLYGGFKTVKFKIKPLSVEGKKPSKKIPIPEKYQLVTDFGAVPDDNIDDTDAIYSAICAASDDTEYDHNIYFPEGKYNIGKGSSFKEVYINKANVNLVLHSNAVLYEAAQPGDGYNAIHIKAGNVSIRGGVLQGERFRHSGGSVGQYGMGIAIDNGKNITIRDMTICDNRGDGIYINDNAAKTVSDVTIKNCDIYNNSRNNIGVIRADNIIIEGCHIYHEKDGISPMAGIDLEPDSGADKWNIHNVLIQDCKIETYQHKSATEVSGLWTYFGVMIIAGYGKPVVKDVTIKNCDIYGDLSIGSSSGVTYPGTTVHGDIIPGDA